MSNKITKQESQALGFNDIPSTSSLIFLGLQFCISNCVSLVYIILIINILKLHSSDAASMMSITLISSAIATLIQANQIGRFMGGGILLSLSASSLYLAPSLLAVKLGGVKLLYGMTLFAGFIQVLMSFLIVKLKKFLPIEISSLVLAIVGFDLFQVGVMQYCGLLNISRPFIPNCSSYVLVNIFPLLLMIICCVWGKNFLKKYYLLIGVIAGYLVIFAFGGLDQSRVADIHNAKWFFIPSIKVEHSFDKSLILPFCIAAIISTIKIYGAVGGFIDLNNQINNKNSNTKSSNIDVSMVRRSALADSVGSILSGMFGSMGLNASPSNISLSISSKILSKYIAYPVAFILLFIAFSSKIALIIVATPVGVTAGLLCLLGAQLFVSSIRLLLCQIKTIKQHWVVSIAFVFGISFFIYPKMYSNMPNYIKLFTGSSIAIAFVVAVVLNLIFFISKKFNIIINKK